MNSKPGNLVQLVCASSTSLDQMAASLVAIKMLSAVWDTAASVHWTASIRFNVGHTCDAFASIAFSLTLVHNHKARRCPDVKKLAGS
jgi:hypothetical protein